ncbi:MAG: hypothetical protein J7J72_04995 [Bacteroidales bacterium]|nr:hypothetical protein [Bacteroidales bacterium]
MTENNIKTKNVQSKTPIYLWVLLVIIALVAGYFIYSGLQKDKILKEVNIEKEAQRVELQGELDTLLADHEQIKQAYGALADSMSVKDSLIIANAKEIKTLLNYKWEYRTVQKKLNRLREVAHTYVAQMDSLYTVNRQLVEENLNIKRRYNSEQRKNIVLEKEKEQLSDKIGEASVLEAYNVRANGIYVKRSGNQVTTDKARRVNKIEVCFTLSKNVVLSPGLKDVYVRIARPDNKILSPGIAEDFVFNYKGEQIQYTIFEQVNYDNDAIDLCLVWEKKYEDINMLEGKYDVIVFADAQEIGTSSFILE